jgi:peptidoglycan/LPS O-acetylase OafA/YrhL
LKELKFNHFHSIDLLRGFAALLVCIFHFTNFKYNNELIFSSDSLVTMIGSYGKNGVYIFFVISGFVIPYSLYKYQFKIQNFFHFISKRFVRIEIPYFASIILVLFVAFVFSFYNDSIFIFELDRLIYHILYFIPFTEFEWYNEIYWTLAIEFQFYIFVGLFFVFIIHSSQFVKIISLSFFLLSGIVVTNNHFVFYYTPIFLIGIITFLIIIEKIEKYLFYLLLLISSLIITYLHSIEIMIFSIATVFLILTVKNEIKWGNWLGKISYSLYLTHGLVGGNFLYLTVRHTESPVHLMILVILALFFSIIFAFLFNKFIEEPSRKWSQIIFFKKY